MFGYFACLEGDGQFGDDDDDDDDSSAVEVVEAEVVGW
jgi:hypothetical protein